MLWSFRLKGCAAFSLGGSGQALTLGLVRHGLKTKRATCRKVWGSLAPSSHAVSWAFNGTAGLGVRARRDAKHQDWVRFLG